jgi:hypothetical protein
VQSAIAQALTGQFCIGILTRKLQQKAGELRGGGMILSTVFFSALFITLSAYLPNDSSRNTHELK